MKALLLTLSLLISTTTFADEEFPFMSSIKVSMVISAPTLLTYSTSDLTNGRLKVAAQIINEGQEYAQTGNMGLLLASNVEVIMNQNSELSETEAVDFLVEYSTELVSK